MSTHRPLVFDPRAFISPPFRDCPNCGKPEYGSLMIGRQSQTNRCRACWHTATRQLPRLAKRLVYVDQMVISNVAKALDPVWSATRRAIDPFWLALFDQLDRLVRLQLIVCPVSQTHERESSVSPYETVLRRLYQHLSEGVSFDFPEQIVSRQLHAVLPAFLTKEPPDYNALVREDVLEGVDALTGWTDRIQLTVNFQPRDGEIENRRETRDRAHEYFEGVIWPRWMLEKDWTFDRRFMHERSALGEVRLTLYFEHLKIYAQVMAGQAPVTEAVWNPRLEVDTVSSLLRFAGELGVAQQDQLQMIVDFFNSEHAQNIPQNRLSALLYAALARKAAAGQKAVPTRGTYNDLQTISCYLPYVDAIYVDDQCAGLIRENPLRAEFGPYRARIFSNRTRTEFLAYLKSLEAEASDEHLELVNDVYGDTWLTPFRTILQYEREREAEVQRESRQGQ